MVRLIDPLITVVDQRCAILGLGRMHLHQPEDGLARFATLGRQLLHLVLQHQAGVFVHLQWSRAAQPVAGVFDF